MDVFFKRGYAKVMRFDVCVQTMDSRPLYYVSNHHRGELANRDPSSAIKFSEPVYAEADSTLVQPFTIDLPGKFLPPFSVEQGWRLEVLAEVWVRTREHDHEEEEFLGQSAVADILTVSCVHTSKSEVPLSQAESYRHFPPPVGSGWKMGWAACIGDGLVSRSNNRKYS